MADSRTMPTAEDAEKGKIMAILGYLCCFLIPLLGAKDNRFCMYHVEQAIVILGVYIIGWVVSMVCVVLAVSTKILMLAYGGYVIYIFGFILMILGIVNAATGKCAPVPLIGEFGAKLNIMK